MNTFTIKATFRRCTPYLKNEDVQSSAPEAIITLHTHRCHVEAILSHMNVESYQIIDCDYVLQIMPEPVLIPAYYYEEA